jgi:UDP-N-acetylmuramate dehydrogenase
MTKIIDFSKYSSIKVGGNIAVTLIDTCNDWDQNSYIIGGCSNILMGENPPALAMLSKKYDFLHYKNNTLTIGGATPSGKIVSFCKKHDIGGFEFLSHLPGKLGGLVKMNAGLKGYEMFDSLVTLTTCNGVFTKEDIHYSYRYTNIDAPILQATFTCRQKFDHQLVAQLHALRKNQPSTPSAGSCFKNPPNDYAGRLIEAVGLKGKRIGAMGWSQKHANFLVNYGGGTFHDAMLLITEAEEKVEQLFGIKLQREIIVLQKELLS